MSSSFLYFKFCFFKLCCVFDIPEIKKNGNVLQGFLHSNKLTEVPNISDDIFLFLLLTLKNVQNVYQTTPTTFAFLSYSTFSMKQSSKSWPYSYRYITSINQDRKREGEASAFSLRIEPTIHCPKVIYCNMKCSGEKVILRRIVHVVSEFPLHFMFYRGDLDCFSNRVSP